MIRRRHRRRHAEPSEMNITAFMNLMVILVPFLLITATFSQIAVLDVTLPGMEATGSPEKTPPRLDLGLVVRRDGLELDNGDQRLAWLPMTQGRYDLHGLDDRLADLKRRHPKVREARLLAEPEVPYEAIIAIMDRLRVDAGGVERFPVIALDEARR